jgi:NTE family protein
MSKPAPTIALMLQGGGALGAYQIGVYEALAKHGLLPDWIAGVSIGAINAAIIAGNAPARRLDQLIGFWNAVSRADAAPIPPALQTLNMVGGIAEAFLAGQPNFFVPRLVNPYLTPNAPPNELSFYDTSPLRATLCRHTDFDLINRQAIRLSLGATNLQTGMQVYFDNTRQLLRSDHVIASGSLPPGFPATAVDGQFYWDGGCVSNTPLDVVLADDISGDLIAFVIDLFDPESTLPATMNEVLWRAKQIQYASRTAQHVDAIATKINLRRALDRDAESLPRLDIVHIVYRSESDSLPFADVDFSRSSIERRREAGRTDVEAVIAARPWLTSLPTQQCRAVVHRVCNQRVETQSSPNLRSVTDRAPKSQK